MKLKPCPFCKSEKISISPDNEYFYICDGCGAEGLITLWDHRPVENELRQEIERLKEEAGYCPPLINKPIQKLTDAMKKKLELNERKGGWSDMTPEMLVSMMAEEFIELCECIRDKEKAIEECADIANFCMMIVNNLQNSSEDES